MTSMQPTMTTDARAVVGRTTKISGKIHGEGDVFVEGRLEGEINITGQLAVAQGGFVDAPAHAVEAQEVIVEGQLDADVHTQGVVQVRSGGLIRGTVRTKQLALEEGAKFAGFIDMAVELPVELGKDPGKK